MTKSSRKPIKIYVLNLLDGTYNAYNSMTEAREQISTTMSDLSKSIKFSYEFYVNKVPYIAWKSKNKIPKEAINEIGERLGIEPKIPVIKVSLVIDKHTTIFVSPDKANESYRLRYLGKLNRLSSV
jgi:hypothetical protein